MGELETQLVSQVIEKTQSELILFMIIIVVALILVALPLYVMVSKDKKLKTEQENVRQDKYIQREAQIIEVIKENSAVIAGLKTTLDSNGTSFVKSLERVHERLNEHSTAERAAHFEIAKINTKMTSVMENQRELSGKINKILVMASGGKLPIQTDGGD